MGVVANICPENAIFCSVKAIANRKLCPSGYVARISRRQNTGHTPGKKRAANKRVYKVGALPNDAVKRKRLAADAVKQ